MASSAVSVVSTSSSYFSRIRDKNRRADFESSTINARLAIMPAPDEPRPWYERKCSAEHRAPERPRITRTLRGRMSPVHDGEFVKAACTASGLSRAVRFVAASGLTARDRSARRRAHAGDEHARAERAG